MRDRTDQPPESHPDTLWPLLVALLVLLTGVAHMWFGHWRRAAMLIGAASLLAGVMRLCLPREVAGLLVVRRRWIDVCVMAGLGVAIMAMALVVRPES